MNSTLHRIKSLLLVSGLAFLAACSSSGGKLMPSPLTPLSAEVQPALQWRVGLGGSTTNHLQPVLSGVNIFAASSNGYVSSIDAPSGTVQWQVSTSDKISAGVAVGSDKVFYVTNNAELVAMSAQNGQVAWRVPTSSQVLTPPIVANGVVAVKSIDNWIQGFDAQTGEVLWGQQRVGPALSLRAQSRMIYAGGLLFAGTAAGELIALTIEDGITRFEGSIAYPSGVSELERMVDVVGAPMIAGNTICAVAFQGRLTCYDLNSGDMRYSRPFSSASGLFVLPQVLFASSAAGEVVAMYTDTGEKLWSQDALLNRQLTAPSVAGQSVVVGDLEGYLHFLKPSTGQLIGRFATDGSPIVSQLVVVPNGTLAQTASGSLYFIAFP